MLRDGREGRLAQRKRRFLFANARWQWLPKCRLGHAHRDNPGQNKARLLILNGVPGIIVRLTTYDPAIFKNPLKFLATLGQFDSNQRKPY